MELDDLRLHPPLRQQIRRLEQLVRQRPVGHQRGVRPLPQHGRVLPGPGRVLPSLAAPGIPDRHRALHVQGRAQHGPQLVKAGRAQHAQARDLAEVPHVLASVVGGPVGAHQPRPVHRQHHMETLQGHIVYEHVEPPLQEAGVHRQHRDHPLPGHARRHGHRVALGDAHVKKPLGPGGGKLLEPRALGHGGGDGADAPVPARQLHQLVAEHIGKIHLLLADNSHRRVKGADAVAALGLALGGGVALALGGAHMEQYRAVQLPGPGQGGTQLVQIVAVHRPQVGEAHVLEHGAGIDGPLHVPLDAVVEVIDPLPAGQAVHHRVVSLLEPVVPRPEPQAAEVGGHAPHVGVDGHAVVVEDDHQGLSRGPRVVEPLVGQPPGEGPVADEGRHGIVRPRQGPGPGHAQGDGHGVGGVARHEGVVDALLRLRKAGEPSQLTQGAKELPAAGEGFVDVALVAYIEHQPVPGGVVGAVERHRQLHRTQVGGQVPAGAGHALHQEAAQLPAQQLQLSAVQPLHVRRGCDTF